MSIVIVSNGGWDNSMDEIKEALDILSYWLREGATVGIFNEETDKFELLKPFDSKKAFILGSVSL